MENQRVIRTLERLGLSNNEIKVYLQLVDHGSNKAGKLSKLASIDRSSCYNALKSLQDRGLVSYVLIGNVKWFQATGPRRLMDYLKEREEELNAILPELQKRHQAVKLEGQVRLFKGLRGIKSIFLDIVRTGEDNFVFGSEGQFSEQMPEFAKQFERMQREKGIRTKLLYREGREPRKTDITESRTLPHLEESPVVTNIYGSKIAIIIWTEEPEGILIENEAAARAYRSYFEFMWSMAG